MSRENSFLTDYKRIQTISGLTAATAVLVTVLVTFLIPVSEQTKLTIWMITGIVAIFVSIYYLVPKLYLNKKLAILPDIVFVIAISLAMKELGEYGYIYIIFFMILAAIDAFIFSLLQFTIIILGMVIGILWSSTQTINFLDSRLVFEIYGLSALAIIMRVIARDALEVREKKEGLENDILELENNKKEIRTLLESLSDGMFVVNSENKITFFNKAALSILGIIATDDKILGRDINDFLPTISPSGPEIITKQAFSSLSQTIRNDLRVVLADKTLKIHSNVSPVIDGKNLQGAIIFFRDITREKNIEEQRAEFNAIASHELRTPLTVIEGYLFFLLDSSSSGAKYNKVTRDYIEKAHQASQDLIRLISDVLTVVKSEENELNVSLQKINLKKLVKEITSSFQKKAKEKKLTLLFKVTTNKLIPDIISDSVKIKEILSNLIENSLKFTEKGTVTVELGLLENETIISVIDTGVGITDSEIKMVFHKFFRSESWKTRKTGGTGLGLYIVKTLIERLGGRVGVQSNAGKGSKFYFTLPLEYKNQEDLKKISQKELKTFISSF